MHAASTEDGFPPPALPSPIDDQTVDELLPTGQVILSPTLRIPLKFSDSDGDSLTLSLVEAPEGAVINLDPGLRGRPGLPGGRPPEFQWTPLEDDGPGTYTVTIKVTDDGLQRTDLQTQDFAGRGR